MKFTNKYHLLVLFALLYILLIGQDIQRNIPISWFTSAFKSTVICLVFYIYYILKEKQKAK